MDSRDALDRSTATAIRVALGVLKRRSREAAGEGQLTTPEFSALALIDRTGPISVADLARQQQMTPQAMGATVTSLERQGLVARTPDPDDRRRALLRVNEAGGVALRSGRDAFSDRMTAAFAGSFTDDEVATLAAAAPLLERLAQHL